MKLDKDLAELDRIAAAADAAHDLDAYEAADAAFFKINRDSRAAWLAAQVRSL